MVCCAAGLALAGCQSLLFPKFKPALLQSMNAASYAGRFRLAYQRWPATANELQEFMCMPGRADKFGLEQYSCDEVVEMPRMELEPRGADLEMNFFDTSNESFCRLRVRAPPKGADTSTFPMVKIETDVFSCRGSP